MFRNQVKKFLLQQLGLGYIEFFESLTSMIDRFVGHLSYLSDYAGTAFQNSEKIQEVSTTRNLRFQW